ncbi:MAG: molybdate transport system ATP-binding protein [Puniceicoccaceae bacterium 5H]|nr:MAG: molybdate transport system ATP-binding protein [Puniceicoccaceae bacterium 5H]
MTPARLSFDLEVPLDRFALKISHHCEHQILGLFGVSGSGKTTCLEAIAGLRSSAKGKIQLGDEAWLDSERGIHVPCHRRDIGYVPQEMLLFPHYDVTRNLRAGRERAQMNGVDFQQTFEAVTEILELGPLLHRRTRDLSGGERQRVALGRALCSGPKLLLLDEPLAALDQRLRQRILPFLLRIRESFQLPILIVSHHPVELQALCDEVLVLKEGAVIAQGQPQSVFSRPDVFNLAESQGFENLLRGTIAQHYGQTTALKLADGQHLIVPRSERPEGQSLLVGIAAHEILLAGERPRALSARNCLRARIATLQQTEDLVLVSTQLDTSDRARIVAEVTPDAARELGLTAGGDIFLVMKANSVRLYE